MTKSEALYTWIVNQLTHLAESDAASAFYETLEGDEAPRSFMFMAEALAGHKAVLVERRAAGVHYDRWSEIDEIAANFSAAFPGFPLAGIAKIRLVGFLATLLSEAEVELDNADVDPEICLLHAVKAKISQPWLVKESGNSLGSLLYFDVSRIEDVRNCISSGAPSAALAFQALATLSSDPQELDGRFALVTRVEPAAEASEIEFFVRLHFLAAGFPVHDPIRISRAPVVINPLALAVGSGYVQWKGVLDVLSEYNSRDELLLKFLTIYHAVEALMYKRPIVELESAMDGAMFSLREFKRLYAALDGSENDALRRLFKLIFAMSPLVGTRFEAIVRNDWQVATSGQIAVVDGALSGFDLGFRQTSFSNDLSANYANLVYRMRNSIVHNKETEFHLTTETTTAGHVLLLKDFLLPTLEKIVFAVISRNDGGLWYKNREIKLY